MWPVLVYMYVNIIAMKSWIVFILH
jgi:hypothetical protein